MIRVVRLVPVLDFGGVESRVVLLSKLIDRARFDFRVCTFTGDGQAARAVRECGIAVDVLGVSARPRRPEPYLALARYLRRLRPHVVHASVAEANVIASVVRLAPGAPGLIVEEVGVPDRSLRGRAVMGAVLRSADAIVGVSRATCEFLIDKQWLPADRVRLINSTVSGRFFEPVMPSPSAPGLRVIAVGRFAPVKNHETLIRAIALARSRGAEVELELVGDGPLKQALESLARELGVSSSVHMPGSRDDVRERLDRASVFALPSLSEGTSISLLEAMARARPVLTSNAPSILETLGRYDRRWALPARDVEAWAIALGELSRMPSGRRAQLGATAREIAEQRFSPAVHRATVEALYVELAARTRSRSARSS